MPQIKAMPGRVILRFPRAKEESKGGIIIPTTSQLRPEMAEIHDIGEPLDEKERITAQRLHELKKAGGKVCVSMASGVRYWEEYSAQALDREEWGWLADYRSYRLGEPASYMEE